MNRRQAVYKSTAPKAASAALPARLPIGHPELHGRERFAAGIEFRSFPSASMQATSAVPAGALSNAKLVALADELFGGGFAETLTMNASAQEGRQRLVKSVYFAGVKAGPLSAEFAAIEKQHGPPSPPRGTDRVLRAARQERTNGWLARNGFSVR